MQRQHQPANLLPMHIQTKIIRNLYSALFFLATPVVLLRLLLRSRHQPAYRRRWRERLGFVKPVAKSCIWMHTVSVGETIAAVPLITQLIAAYPAHTIYITTTTPTGSEQVSKHFGNQVAHSYLPYDVPWFLKRFLRRTNPQLCIIMETEVWPNILFCCKHAKIPTLLANARLSEKSYHGYARLKLVATDLFNLFTRIAAQSALDAEHFKLLGVDPQKITVTGSIKFDRDIDTQVTTAAQQNRQQWQLDRRPVIIAASTRDGEEAYILDAYQQLKQIHPEAFLILVPRHTERCEQIIKLCAARQFTLQRRSLQDDQLADQDILLGDTIGELFLLYACADIAYVGGSLVDTGCHNVLEPAALGMPIITGPSLRNFKTICAMLQHAEAQIIIHNAAELAATWQELIEDKKKAQSMGQNAVKVYQSNKGATQKLLRIISSLD